MSVVPSGVSIQEIYRRYRENQLIVNRVYQRKLVWTEREKQMLIDSIIKGFPIPLILLAEKNVDGLITYEILDGLQRLNAIVGFIENEFSLGNHYFDVDQLARAKQAENDGLFSRAIDVDHITEEESAGFLDYQLAVTSYRVVNEITTYEIFGRINSGGRQLSNQERRQAGVICDFTTIVRTVAAEIRGDSTDEKLILSDMPQISIGSTRDNSHYGLSAEDTFWIKQGILSIQDLRNSDDEELIADIAISILFGEPFARSKESLDTIYDVTSEAHEKLSVSLIRYTPEKLKKDIQNTFSVIKNCVESVSEDTNYLRTVVMYSSSSKTPIKNAFYTVFMAFYQLLVVEDLSPCDASSIIDSLKDLQQRIKIETHYATTSKRKDNINVTIGLIRDFFARKEPSALMHGSGLIIDFENSIRRSKIETPRYEFKQGMLRLSKDRKYDSDLERQILKTICAIANIGPSTEGYIFIGVADTKKDAERIEEIDGIHSIRLSTHYVVGIDREAKIQGLSLEDYCRKIVGFIKNSALSSALISSVLSNIDIIDYRGMSVVRIKIPSQAEISYLGEDVFERQYNNTIKIDSAKEILSIAKRFT